MKKLCIILSLLALNVSCNDEVFSDKPQAQLASDPQVIGTRLFFTSKEHLNLFVQKSKEKDLSKFKKKIAAFEAKGFRSLLPTFESTDIDRVEEYKKAKFKNSVLARVLETMDADEDKKNDRILFAPVLNVTEGQSEQLLRWTTDYLTEKMLSLEILDYWDVNYRAKILGLSVPSPNNYDRNKLVELKEALSVDYILFSILERVRENDVNNLDNNPSYEVKEAILNHQLLDLKSRSIVWVCKTQVRAGPLRFSTHNNANSINLRSSTFAINKAYKESIEKLSKSFLLVN